MRRWLTLLLLVMLPLQFSWAAAAAYCQHEASASARHVGHHEHEHQAGVGDPQAGASAEKAAESGEPAGDNDCGYCHLSAAKPLQVQPLEVPAVAGLAARAAPVHPLQTRGPDRRERPNWRLA
jgi:hypothetical protein